MLLTVNGGCDCESAACRDRVELRNGNRLQRLVNSVGHQAGVEALQRIKTMLLGPDLDFLLEPEDVRER